MQTVEWRRISRTERRGTRMTTIKDLRRRIGQAQMERLMRPKRKHETTQEFNRRTGFLPGRLADTQRRSERDDNR